MRLIVSPAVPLALIDNVVGLGLVKMIAPLLGVENADVPLILVADTLTYTPEPQVSEYGIALTEAIGTVHVVEVR